MGSKLSGVHTLIEQLRAGIALDRAQVTEVVGVLTGDTASAEAKADLLTALAQKGETADEIAGFALELRERALTPPLHPETRAGEILDVCGTGGDRLNTFNISTTVAMVGAAAGIPVAKHGNRAITSQAGSADVLEALGVRIDLTPAEAAAALATEHFAFFFAPTYHPSFRHIGPARRLCAERGQRTIFNFLGPLLNPVRPTAQLIGVPRPELCEPMGRVLQAIGARRGMIVSGQVPRPNDGLASATGAAYLDELSTLGDNVVAEFYQDRGFAVSTLATEHFPLQPATLADLKGGTRQENAGIVWQILKGDDRGPKRDAVLLNAAAALFVGGKARSLTDGWGLAAELIDSGQAARKLASLASRAR